jgi:hypothetical protein
MRSERSVVLPSPLVIDDQRRGAGVHRVITSVPATAVEFTLFSVAFAGVSLVGMRAVPCDNGPLLVLILFGWTRVSGLGARGLLRVV